METKAFAIYDTKAEFFTTPFFMQTKGLAIRAFSEAAGDAQTNFCKFPNDFILFEVGTFDDKSGKLVALEAPIHIGFAAELRRVPTANHIGIKEVGE